MTQMTVYMVKYINMQVSWGTVIDSLNMYFQNQFILFLFTNINRKNWMSSWAVLQGSSLLFTKTQGSGTGWVSEGTTPHPHLSVNHIKYNKMKPFYL